MSAVIEERGESVAVETPLTLMIIKRGACHALAVARDDDPATLHPLSAEDVDFVARELLAVTLRLRARQAGGGVA